MKDRKVDSIPYQITLTNVIIEFNYFVLNYVWKHEIKLILSISFIRFLASIWAYILNLPLLNFPPLSTV
jgi:hypothetical protein